MNKKAIQKATETLGRDYQKWIKNLKIRYRQSQIRASLKVNGEMLNFYWELGRDIVEMHAESRWGDKLLQNLSRDMKSCISDIEGVSVTNLLYMKNFYSMYKPLLEITPQVGERFTQTLYSIPWGHHKLLIDKFKKAKNGYKKALFYIRKTIENGWSRAVLLNMMDANVYESSGKAQNNFSTALPKEQNDIAQEIVKDPYHFDFLCFSKDYKEADLQKGLEENICKYLLELGKGFAFVGRQVRLEVGGDEYFCDQLFYHIKLKCYVVVELKIVKFEPEFVSKLNFYCNAVNHLIKAPEENDTIGLLICKKKNDLVVQWTVEKNMEPIAITSYELSQIMDASLKGR